MKRKASVRAKPGSSSAFSFHTHTGRTKQQIASCAICRLAKLYAAAESGDHESPVAIAIIALTAARMVEELRGSGNPILNELLLTQSEWPIVATAPDQKRPWLLRLGEKRGQLPVPIRKLKYRDTETREILILLLNVVRLLVDLAEEKRKSFDAERAKPVESFPLERWSFEDEEFMASFRHAGRQALKEFKLRLVEFDTPPRSIQDDLRDAFDRLLSKLQLSLTKDEVLGFIDAYLPKAAKLPPAGLAKLDDWHAVGMDLLFQLHDGAPEQNPVLKKIVGGVGKRKQNAQGTAKENLKAVRDKLAEYFGDRLDYLRDEADVETVWGLTRADAP